MDFSPCCLKCYKKERSFNIMNTEGLKMSTKRSSNTVFFVKVFVTLMMVIQPVAPVWAAPQGEQVVSGDVSFSRTGDLTQIQATTVSSITAVSTFSVTRPYSSFSQTQCRGY